MATRSEWQARQRANFLRLYRDGFLTANELFPSLLDTFSDGHIPAELDAEGPEVRDVLREFLAGHRPLTFYPHVIGVPPTPERAAIWEQERLRIYAALLVALRVTAPGETMNRQGQV
jgi:hypothetical protein